MSDLFGSVLETEHSSEKTTYPTRVCGKGLYTESRVPR